MQLIQAVLKLDQSNLVPYQNHLDLLHVYCRERNVNTTKGFKAFTFPTDLSLDLWMHDQKYNKCLLTFLHNISICFIPSKPIAPLSQADILLDLGSETLPASIVIKAIKSVDIKDPKIVKYIQSYREQIHPLDRKVKSPAIKNKLIYKNGSPIFIREE